MSDEQRSKLPGDEALIDSLLQTAPEPPSDFVPGTASPPEVRPEKAAERASVDGESLPSKPEFTPGVHKFDPAAFLDTQAARQQQAAFLELEARSQPSALAMARGLLLAAELWMQLGDTTRAATCTEDAASRAPSLSLTHTLRRATSPVSKGNDTHETTWLEALKLETRLGNDAATRAHGAWLLADLLRVKGDDDGLAHAEDSVRRQDGADLRPVASQLAQRLAQNENPLQVHVPSESPLKEAALRVRELAGGREASEPTPTLLLERTRRHLSGHRWVPAARSLMEAAELGVSTPALLDVAASLVAQDMEGRPLAIEALKRRLQGGTSRAILRTLAARALEQGDKAALEISLDLADPASGTFELGERILLSLLGGAALKFGDLDLDAIAEKCDPALAIALADHTGSRPDGSEGAFLAAIGSQLVRTHHEELFFLLDSLDSDSALRHALQAELALAARDPDATAHALRPLANCTGIPELYEVVGLIHEAQGHMALAAEAYAQAHDLGPRLRLVRALADTGSDVPLVPLLSALASSAANADSASVLWLEAALGAPPAEAQSLLEQSVAKGGLQKLVAQFGSYLAARENDGARRMKWLSRARQAAESDAERGLFLLQELACADTVDAAAWMSSIASLIASRPYDLSLLKQHLDLSGASALDSAEAYLRASAASDAEAAWLAARATLLAFRAGELDMAGRALRRLRQLQSSPLADAFSSLLAEDGSDATELVQQLLTQTHPDRPVTERIDALERLAQLDEARGDLDGCMEWHRAVLTEDHHRIRSLHYLERELLRAEQPDLLEPIAASLATALSADDAVPYRTWLGARRLLDGDLRAARSWLEPLVERPAPPALAVRALDIHARQVGDDATLHKVASILAASRRDPADACTASLRAAQFAAHLGHLGEALARIDRALHHRPGDLVALWLRCELLEASWPALAAPAWQELALQLSAPSHRLAAWLKTGRLWLATDAEGFHSARARTAFSEALALDPTSREAFVALRKLAEQGAELAELVQLLEARYEHATDLEERVELQQSLARCFHALGQPRDERSALERWFEFDPRPEPSALRSHAEACYRLEDYEAAKTSWLRVLERASEGTLRTTANRALAHLYEEHLGDPRSAAHIYEGLLAERSADTEVVARLVDCYTRLEISDRAIELQTKRIQLSETAREKQEGALLLAKLYEELAKDAKRALATLERARKAWPFNPDVLAALARFMERNGESSASRLLLDRTSKEVWRKLEGERVEPSLLELLATITELQGYKEQARSTHSARQAWLGEDEGQEGALTDALREELEELLAPQEMSGALRTLLRKTGRAFDMAFPIDPRAIFAEPVESGKVWQDVRNLSRSAGLGDVEVFTTPQLGARCLPGRGASEPNRPHQILIGPRLAALETQERRFLILRALKLQHSGAGALARSRPEDTWPMLAAMLHLFAPNWTPPLVDQEKFILARGQLERGLGQLGYEDDVPFLVLEAIGTLTQHTSHLGETARLLANRAALLGTGALGSAFSAFAHLAERPLAERGPSRWRWLNGHPEARDLALFCASQAYAKARIRLGLAPEEAHFTSRVPSLLPRPPQKSMTTLKVSVPPAPPPPRRS